MIRIPHGDHDDGVKTDDVARLARRLAELARTVAQLHPVSVEAADLAADVEGLADAIETDLDSEPSRMPTPGRYGRKA